MARKGNVKTAVLRKRFAPSNRIRCKFRIASVMVFTTPVFSRNPAFEQMRIIPDCSVNIRKKVIMHQIERVRPPFKLKK